MKSLDHQLTVLLSMATKHGLHDRDRIAALEFLEHQEYGLCFDIIVTQLYEFDIPIDQETYDMIVTVGESMKLSLDSFDFTAGLIDTKTP